MGSSERSGAPHRGAGPDHTDESDDTAAPESFPAGLLPAACRAIARHYFGAAGEFAYAAFDYLNSAYFAGALPDPLITWALTAHGRCLAATYHAATTPLITLHPSLLGGRDAVAPWGIAPELLGPVLACDVLLHECIHLAVAMRHHTKETTVLNTGARGVEMRGVRTGTSSHNNPAWIAEVNRLAPLVGLAGLVATGSTTVRVPLADVPPGPRGRPRTVVQRVSGVQFNGAPLPFAAVAGFPYAARQLLGATDGYVTGSLPFLHPFTQSPHA